MSVNGIGLASVFLLAGLVSGFCSSAPLGPINIWVADATISKQRHKISWFLFGVVFVDIIFAALAAWGYYSVLQDESVANWLPLVGGIFLILLGLSGIFRKDSPGRLKPEAFFLKQYQRFKNFGLGAFLCGSNPAFLLFWIFVVNQLDLRIGIKPDVLQLLMFLLGVGLGDLIWFNVFIRFVAKGIDLLNPRYIQFLRASISFIFLIFGCYAILHIYW